MTSNKSKLNKLIPSDWVTFVGCCLKFLFHLSVSAAVSASSCHCSYGATTRRQCPKICRRIRLYPRVSECERMCVSTLLTGDVVLCRRLPVQPVKICMSVCLRGVYPVPHCQALHGRTSRGQARRRGVVLGADPGEGARARVRGVAAVARHRRYSGAVAVIHRADQDFPATVLRQYGLLGGVRGAAASRGKVRGAEHGARVVVGQGAAPAACATALADVRRAAGTEGLLIGGLAFSRGGARAQVRLLSQGWGRRWGRGGGVLETWRSVFSNVPVALWEGRGMFPFLWSGARALAAGIRRNRLQEGRGRGEGNFQRSLQALLSFRDFRQEQFGV